MCRRMRLALAALVTLPFGWNESTYEQDHQYVRAYALPLLAGVK